MGSPWSTNCCICFCWSLNNFISCSFCHSLSSWSRWRRNPVWSMDDSKPSSSSSMDASSRPFPMGFRSSSISITDSHALWRGDRFGWVDFEGAISRWKHWNDIVKFDRSMYYIGFGQGTHSMPLTNYSPLTLRYFYLWATIICTQQWDLVLIDLKSVHKIYGNTAWIRQLF